MPVTVTSMLAFMLAKPRLRYSDSGSIGVAARASQATNAASSSPPPIRLPRTWGLVQPCPLPRTRPNTTPNSPPVISTTPSGSSRPAPDRLSVTSHSSDSSSRPIGTLIQKIHCQDPAWVTAPPMTGPSAAPRPAVALHRPRARPRLLSGVTLAISVMLSGMTIAAPAPCTARAAISTPMLGASAAAALDRVNTVIPTANIRRRPYRSPRAAPVSISTANVSV